MASGVVRLMVALVLVSTVLMAGTSLVQSQYRDSVRGANEVVVVNESFTVDEGNVTALSESNRSVVYAPNVSVDQSGTTFDAGGNYSWLRANGTIRVQSGSQLTDGQSANITYNYSEPSNDQQLARQLGEVPTVYLGDAIPLALGAALLLGSVAVLARLQQ